MSASIVVCWVGKTAAPYARLGIEEYSRRVERYRSLRVVEVAQERRGEAARRLQREGERILERLARLQATTVIALDPAAEQLDSQQFAALMRRYLLEQARSVAFVVGGPDGLSSGVLERANARLGLSRLTFPHDMARLLLMEQIYRSLTILQGHPYDR